MSVIHALMGVGNVAGEFENHRIEQNEAHLVEQAAAELLRVVDWHDENRIRKMGERALRLCVSRMTSAFSPLAIRAKLTLTGVSPEPDTITRPSPLRIDGAVGSPTTCTSRPKFMKCIAAI
jgi:hypothetical protein